MKKNEKEPEKGSYQNTAFKDLDQREKDFEIYETYLESQKIKANELRKTPKSTLWLHILVVTLILISEYIMYQKVAYGVIRFEIIESFLIALVVIGIAKLFSIPLKPLIFEWIKAADKKTKSISKKMLMITSFLIVINLIAFGSLNVFDVNKNNNLNRIATLQTQIEVAEKNKEDTSTMDEELKTQLERQNGEDPIIIRILIYIAVGLLSLLSVLSASINYIYVMYIQKSRIYERKIEKITGLIEKSHSDLDYINETKVQVDGDVSAVKFNLKKKDTLEELISKKYSKHNSLPKNLNI